MKDARALIVVDVQRDFCPGGALPVKEGDGIIEGTNRLISEFEKNGLPVFFTRDWHPSDHCSFSSRGGPWPPHCVKNTPGAEFHPDLRVPKSAVIISKGTRKDVEAYSGFQGTDLAERLERLGVERLYVAGLATDYCVKATVLDGIANGFKVDIVGDCVKGVNMKSTSSASAYRTMMSKGVKKTTSEKVLKEISRRVAVSSSF
jgi:nicotinamidase/pyrazinamidase